MAAESKANQILAYVVSQLASMPAGPDYWYPPQRVRRVRAPYLEYWERALGQGDPPGSSPLLCFYMVYRGPLSDTTLTTGTREKLLEFHVVASRRVDQPRAAAEFAEATVLDASPITPDGETIQDRLELDVEKRLCGGDLTFGGRIMELNVPDRNRELVVDGWDVAHVMFLVTYKHVRSQP